MVEPLNVDVTIKGSNIDLKYNPILTDKVWNEVKDMVTEIWNTFDNEFGYVDGKMDVVNSLPKKWTSVIRMIKMFHYVIQREIIFDNLSQEANESIKLEMYDRGWSTLDF